MHDRTEYTLKRARIAALMHEHAVHGLVLGRSASWSWATCGAQANVGLNSEHAAALLLFTARGDYVLANTIELPRLLAEEIGDLPLEPVAWPWHDPSRRMALLADLAGGPLASDAATLPGVRQIAPAIAALRSQLTVPEQVRLRALGAAAGAAIAATAHQIVPGMREHEIAGMLAAETYRCGATPVVVLVAADERAYRYRHPLPTDRPLERYAMLVLCARRHGLIASVSRLVHFGPAPADLHARVAACATLDASLHLHTRPGRNVADLFADLQGWYAAVGYPDEWQQHHQGGLTGYENRELLALPDATFRIASGQAYAWNPSIAGAKSEDTILIDEQGYAVLTATADWPQISVSVSGQTVQRPALLERY
jgi:antitoxin VapB